ncbi:hypothetical protein Tco_1423165 [Tanacetum coccineum]
MCLKTILEQHPRDQVNLQSDDEKVLTPEYSKDAKTTKKKRKKGPNYSYGLRTNYDSWSDVPVLVSGHF